MRVDLSPTRLRELLHYDPLTGIFVWRVKRRGYTEAGDIAGSAQTGQYVRIQVDGRAYGAHVLAWLYMHGVWPSGEIDHRDGVRGNNVFTNLRDATVAMNRQNLHAAPKSNRHSGLLGAHWCGGEGRATPWRAAIVVNNRRRYLGHYATPEEAHAVYIAAKRQLHEGNTL